MIIWCVIVLSNVFNILAEFFVGGIAFAVYQIKLHFENKHKGD